MHSFLYPATTQNFGLLDKSPSAELRCLAGTGIPGFSGFSRSFCNGWRCGEGGDLALHDIKCDPHGIKAFLQEPERVNFRLLQIPQFLVTLTLKESVQESVTGLQNWSLNF